MQSNSSMEEGLSPVIRTTEIQRFQDLGLGRGVNVTDPQMWKNKSHFLIRKVKEDLTNVIGTEESGMMEKYEKEVSTVATQQVKIRLSLDDPSSQVKIGMDAHHSQSTSSTKIIAGTKVKTRTISFRVDCHDLPVYTPADDTTNSIDVRTGKSEESIEKSLYSWIFERMENRGQIHSEVKSLTAYFANLPSVQTRTRTKELREIANDCKLFVNELGITHYVSGIELGALKYSVFTSSRHQTTQGAGAEVGAGQLAEGGISGIARKLRLQTSREQQEIGKISSDKPITRNTTDEAVIGFQIQPIHNLVRHQLIQVALQKAVKKYIEFKADKSDFMQDQQRDNLLESRRGDTSEDTKHPSEFFLTHYEKESNEEHFNENDPFIKLQIKKSQRPWHIASNSNMLGFSSQPLDLKPTVRMQQARFSLHSRVQQSFAFMMCLSTPVSLNDWTEGEEFYINCSRRSLAVDGYVAMKRLQYPFGPYGAYTYRTQTTATMKDPTHSKDIGMLFRLSTKSKRAQSTASQSLVETPSVIHSQVSDEPDRGDDANTEDETRSRAMKKYIEFKADKSEGPFRISCKINNKTIYWTRRAYEEKHQVVGTEAKADASLFFITPTEDMYRPFEFFLTHCEEDESSTLKNTQMQHVASNSNKFGNSSQPLDLTLTQQARFSLCGRTQSSFPFTLCRSTPVIPCDWIEGEKLYLKCSQHSFEVDRYVAMKQLLGPPDAIYSTQTMTTMKDPTHSNDIGMLFQLSKKHGQPQLRASYSLAHDQRSKREVQRQMTASESSSEDESSAISSSNDSMYATASDGEAQNQPITALGDNCPFTAPKETYALLKKNVQPQVPTEPYFEEGGLDTSSLNEFSSSSFDSEGEFQPKRMVSFGVGAQNQPITALGDNYPFTAPKETNSLLKKNVQPQVPTEPYFEEGGLDISSLNEFSSSSFDSEGVFQPKRMVSTPVGAQNQSITTLGRTHPTLRETQPTATHNETYRPLRKNFQQQVPSEPYYEDESSSKERPTLNNSPWSTPFDSEEEFQPKLMVSTPVGAQNQSIRDLGETHPVADHRETLSAATYRETHPTAVLKQTQSTAALRETQPMVTRRKTRSTAAHGETQSMVTRRKTRSTAAHGETQPMVTHRKTRSTAALGETQPMVTRRKTRSTAAHGETQPMVTRRKTRSTAAHGETQPMVTRRKTRSMGETQSSAVATERETQSTATHRKTQSVHGETRSKEGEDTQPSGVDSIKKKQRSASSKKIRSSFPVSIANTYDERYEQMFGYD